MNNNCTVKSGNVVLVDPNCVNVNTNQTNAIPKYEDMHIDVDLVATRRGRSILFTGGARTDKSITINLMGFNQNTADPKDPNYENFTTNYYDGSTGTERQYESFGIRSVKATINSSFIPEVNIEFVDIRGLSFFNQGADKETSPYRILFDFPPPIFELTIKGYYGKTLRYKLHLVNYTSDFSSDNGNFVINANFVAVTFAPLADLLFRYVVNFPLITAEGFDPKSTEPPQNTFELILKTKRLLTATEDFKMDSIEKQNYDDIVKKISKTSSVMTFLAGSKQSSKLSEIGNPPVFFIRNKSENQDMSNIDGRDTGSLVEIDSLNKYNDVIISKQKVGRVISMDERLYIGYELGQIAANEPHPSYDDERVKKMKKVLNALRDELISKAMSEIGASGGDSYTNQIQEADVLASKHNFDEFLEDDIARYVVLDLTDFYLFLYNELVSDNQTKTELINILNTAINNLVLESLGMIPTIYNVFKIILDDVDKFFTILRTTSNNAFEHHNENDDVKSIIVNPNFRDVGREFDEDIYSFPLVIRTKSQCGRLVEERIAPIELSNILSDSFGPFPELVLVQDFINTFRRQANLAKQYYMLDEQNADGSYMWIPISPFDSRLATERLSTPYIRVDSSAGGAESRPIPVDEDNRLNVVLKILLNRFYVLSQFVLPDKFKTNNSVDNELIMMHADAEAVNLAISVSNENLRDNLKTFADTYKDAGNAIIQYIAINLPEYFTSVGGDGNTQFINLRTPIYTNKNDISYVGCRIIRKDLDLTEVVIGKSTKPIDLFREEIKGSSLGEKLIRFFKGQPDVTFLSYVQENIFHIRDGVGSNRRNTEQATILESRFCLHEFDFNNSNNPDNVILSIGVANIKVLSKKIYFDKIITINENNKNRYNGNVEIGKFGVHRNASKLSRFGNIINVWANSLAHNDNINKMYDKIFNVDNPDEFKPRLSSIILLSNFGYTASPFNIYKNNINEYVFNNPAAINVPTFLPLYIGSLVDIEVGDDLFNEIYEFFLNGEGNTLPSGGLTILGDIVDIIQKLSPNEKKEFKEIYEDWYRNGATNISNGYGRLVVNMNSLCQKYFQSTYKDYNEKKDKLKNLLSVNEEYYPNTLGRLTRDNYILNYSELTFDFNDKSQENFIPLKQITGVTNNDINKNTERFFVRFLTRLSRELNKVNDDDEEDRIEFEKLTADEDIITQTYYSFKNINDKWLVQPEKETQLGYPFNGKNNDNLINLFAFVDRAMNPVGDTVINPEALVELFEDTDVSVFSVLSNLLSSNGFEFFPLQNFMLIDYDESEDRDDWSQSFKINTSGKVNDSPFFVCMYIGGSSRMVSGIEKFGNFEDDGITDLLNPGTGHFSSSDDCGEGFNDRDSQKEGNPDFPWGEVRAFRVRFAEQNQSMFKDMSIDSKEFPETNESIQILSRLAGDNRANAPIPKGQNLYNLYENRAYSTTVTGLGNAMIQPTQYFQLENVPLYNGAYLILNVEHTIEANKMSTTFSGTKILKYPIPRVTNAAAIFGFDGADSDVTNAGATSIGGVILGAGTGGNPDEAKYNSMYTQNVKE